MSVSRGMRRFVFALACLSGIGGASASEPVTVQSFAHKFGFRIETNDEQTMRLTGGGRTVELRPGKREATIDGLRVFLGWPVAAAKEGQGASLQSSDAERVLEPILAPVVELKVRHPLHVVLDPGHGGRDDGGRSAEPVLMEKDLTLRLAKMVGERLQASGRKVTFTRSEDVFVALADRPQLANSVGGDLFVSLHFNIASGLPAVRGVETYVLTPRGAPSTNDTAESAAADPRRTAVHPGNATDRANALLGFVLHRRLVADLGTADRGLKRSRFAVLRDLEMPGVLVEGAYLSNADEVALLRDPAWLRKLAESIFAGIEEYARALEKAGVARPPN